MREIFIKYRVVIFRVVGIFMLLFGSMVYFLSDSKEVLSQNDIAAANVARIEASVMGVSANANGSSTSHALKIVEELQNTQEQQIRYLTILSMILGAGFLVYSFMQKPKNDFEK